MGRQWHLLVVLTVFAASATLAADVPHFVSPRKFWRQLVYQVKPLPPEKVVALTFDDGPWGASTRQVLQILKEEEAKATFFILGKHALMYPDIIADIVKGGHAVGNHSWSHPYQPVDPKVAKQEIENTSALIAKQSQAQTRLFRPPGGNLTTGLVDYAKSKNYAVIMWSVDPHDTRPNTTAADIVERTLKNVKPGSIILLHDGGGDRATTRKALPTLIRRLRQKGYRFVTVPELLQLAVKAPPPKPETPTPQPTITPTPTPEGLPTPQLTPSPPSRSEPQLQPRSLPPR
ncbi:MAG TPA: polysaccharide deacetylase family protein [Thermosynechococcus sp. M3746_W2019_013]|uniref:polysaccharide deacetylase family protein n=1 Tax=Thermosynechococcus sp. M3746_W2019_013 TaxID=2747806 RepID=UPI001A0EBB82|nr:polysaccharide deacetylase family protein [Thermosynechococcus sp. M3746_W2019_013]HIK22204.1 polysaccharide deacetylase family protein [Thermosynechococcus sp. M3746_W2019_013]